MKIFPPISEMLWPPGYSAGQLLWARRYPVLAVAGMVLAFSATSSVLQFQGPESAKTADTGTKHIVVDGANCRDLRLALSNRATSSGPCDAPLRMKAGQSLADKQPLQRGGLITTQGTLTAADIAIEPPKALRTSIWKPQYEAAEDEPALAQTPPALAQTPPALTQTPGQ